MINIKNLEAILDYSYDDEINHLEECISEENEDFEELPEDLQGAIDFIQKEYPHYTTHIGYNLMILKQDLQNELSNKK